MDAPARVGGSLPEDMGAVMRPAFGDALRIGEILSCAAQTEIMPRFGALTAGPPSRSDAKALGCNAQTAPAPT
jgi:hypothetical protein